MRGTWRSWRYRIWPVTFSGPSRFGTDRPMTLNPLTPPSSRSLRGSRDRSLAAQALDLRLRVAQELREDLLGVLPERRRRSEGNLHRTVHLDRAPEARQAAERGVLEAPDHLAQEDLGIGEDLVHLLDGRGRDSFAVEDVEPLRGRPPLEGFLDQRDQRLPVVDAVGIGGEAGVALPLGLAHPPAEAPPELLGEDGDDQRAVAGLERLVRHHRSMARAHGAGHLAVGPEVLGEIREERDLSVQEREVDDAPLPRPLPPEERPGHGEGA